MSDDIWSLALKEKKKKDSERKQSLGTVRYQGDTSVNSYVFFVGSQNSGKTTLLLRFLEREEPPKPTTALDYTYGRRSRGPNMAKDVAHLWELGGGTFLSKLIDVPISVETLSNISIVLLVDLSKPEELWSTLEVFIKQIRLRVNFVLSDLKTHNPDLAQQIVNSMWKKFGEDHPDKDLLDPCPIPLAIIGSKYDIFQDFDPEKKKVISKTLRFVAHVNGASLHFFTIKSDGLLSRMKQLIGHLAFGTGLSNAVSLDHTKPLLIPAGSDNLGQIGIPSLTSAEIGKINAKNPMELWKQAFCGFYPQVKSQQEVADDPCKDSKYRETAVDAMRVQKDEDLQRYRRECERKARDQARKKGQTVKS